MLEGFLRLLLLLGVLQDFCRAERVDDPDQGDELDSQVGGKNVIEDAVSNALGEFKLDKIPDLLTFGVAHSNKSLLKDLSVRNKNYPHAANFDFGSGELKCDDSLERSTFVQRGGGLKKYTLLFEVVLNKDVINNFTRMRFSALGISPSGKHGTCSCSVKECGSGFQQFMCRAKARMDYGECTLRCQGEKEMDSFVVGAWKGLIGLVMLDKDMIVQMEMDVEAVYQRFQVDFNLLTQRFHCAADWKVDVKDTRFRWNIHPLRVFKKLTSIVGEAKKACSEVEVFAHVDPCDEVIEFEKILSKVASGDLNHTMDVVCQGIDKLRKHLPKYFPKGDDICAAYYKFYEPITLVKTALMDFIGHDYPDLVKSLWRLWTYASERMGIKETQAHKGSGQEKATYSNQRCDGGPACIVCDLLNAPLDGPLGELAAFVSSSIECVGCEALRETIKGGLKDIGNISSILPHLKKKSYEMLEKLTEQFGKGNKLVSDTFGSNRDFSKEGVFWSRAWGAIKLLPHWASAINLMWSSQCKAFAELTVEDIPEQLLGGA